jgi:ubiquinone/menaquinone biosynthesis C-methylase UbiE
MNERIFVPALPDHRLTPFYDATVSLMTCERTWRRAFVRQIAPEPRDVILDVGCGTGTLAIMLKQACPSASVYGTDPDPEVLSRAELKARDAGVLVHLSQGFAEGTASVADANRPNKVVSSLVLHQIPLEWKRETIASTFAALRSGGELHVADYGEQKSPLMKFAFRQVQALDGVSNTQPNADGILPQLMRDAGFSQVQENTVIPTPTGSISLYSAVRL